MRLFCIVFTFLICITNVNADFLSQLVSDARNTVTQLAQTKQAINFLNNDQNDNGQKRYYDRNDKRQNVARKTHYAKNDTRQNGYVQIKKAKNITKQRNYNQQSNYSSQQKIKIAQFFPAKSIARVSLDENAERVAIARNDGTIDIKNLTRQTPTQTIQAEIFGGIKSMYFIGENYILYTCVDERHSKHLIKLDIDRGEYRDITPIKNCKHVRIYGQTENAIILSSDGNTSYLHKINASANSLDTNEILKTNNIITNVILNPNTTSFIYVTAQRNGTRSCMLHRENEKDICVETPRENDLYVALNNEDVIFKISNNSLISTTSNGSTKILCKVQNLENSIINIDNSGNPSFITIKREFNTHIPIKKTFDIEAQTLSMNDTIKMINNYFQNHSWERIDSSKDGRYWLLKITNSMQYTQYVIVDILNIQNATKICMDGRNKRINTHRVFHINVFVARNRSVGGFVTLPANYQRNTPAILFLRRSNSAYFSAQYDFMNQYLADRGYIVFCINQDCNNKNFSTNTDINKILNSLKKGWRTNKYQIHPIDIKKTMLVSFCKDTSIFSKCMEENASPISQLACICFINPKNKLPNKLNIPTIILLHNMLPDTFKNLCNKQNISIFSVNNDNATWGAILTRFMSQSSSSLWYDENINFENVNTYNDNLSLLQ